MNCCYLHIEDHGLIGDGSTAALVGRNGAISWAARHGEIDEALWQRILIYTNFTCGEPCKRIE